MGLIQNVKLRLAKEGIQPLTRKSRLWLRQKVSTIARVDKKRLMESGTNLGEVLVGRMFFFAYDPKYKAVLPYYDRFPLVIPIDIYDDGFLGLNLHYLDRTSRLRLFDKLLDFASRRDLTPQSKMRITYELLKAAGNIPEFEPCVHKYLYDHVRTMFLKIPADEWEIAIFLPVESFAKSTLAKVWIDSRRKMRKLKRKEKVAKLQVKKHA